MRYFDRAALFMEACLQYGAVEVSEDTDILCQGVIPGKQTTEWALEPLLAVLPGRGRMAWREPPPGSLKPREWGSGGWGEQAASAPRLTQKQEGL